MRAPGSQRTARQAPETQPPVSTPALERQAEAPRSAESTDPPAAQPQPPPPTEKPSQDQSEAPAAPAAPAHSYPTPNSAPRAAHHRLTCRAPRSRTKGNFGQAAPPHASRRVPRRLIYM